MSEHTASSDDFDFMETEGFVRKHARRLGRALALHALKLFYVVQDPATPMSVKGPIIVALIYLGVPLDAVPDPLPAIGFSDDLAVLAGAITLANVYITDEIVARAEQQYKRWFDKRWIGCSLFSCASRLAFGCWCSSLRWKPFSIDRRGPPVDMALALARPVGHRAGACLLEPSPRSSTACWSAPRS